MALTPQIIGDWKRVIDKQSGKAYYSNTSTGTKQWKSDGTPFHGLDEAAVLLLVAKAGGSPSSATAAATESPVASSTAAATATATTSNAPDSTVGDWKRTLDAKSGKYYYVNLSTKEKTWKVEGTSFAGLPMPTPPAAAAAALTGAATSAAATPNSPGPLRVKDGWKEMMNADGRKYYIEIATKKSTWKIAETPFASS